MQIRNYKKKQIVIIFAIMLCLISCVTVFGRFVTNSVSNFFLRSKEFYFYSDKLSDERAVFQIDNWSGVEDYIITINMNSRKNNIQVASYDIAYDISYTCSNNAICQLSKTSGIISKDTNTDFFNLIITPNTQMKTGDKVTVEIEATSKTGYTKTIKGKFTLVVGKENLTYQITDSVNSPYMDIRITNTISYYNINQAFGSYNVGDKIDIDTYLALSDSDKLKCYSSIVTLDADIDKVLVDITNENFINATNIVTQQMNGKNYIKSFTISMEAISSVDLRFYKVDSTANYTYPNSQNYSVIDVISR